MQSVQKYFPNLTPLQIDQLSQLGPLYHEWNEKINVISRKDIQNIYPHHILHSLAIAKEFSFKEDAEILDLGTGGGLPGIPLAILFPETKFLLVDGTGKKIRVANEIISAVGLKNVEAKQVRAEELKQKFDFVVCRAVTGLDRLIPWAKSLLKKEQRHAVPNGLITLKGGNLKAEIKGLPNKEYIEMYALSDYFEEAFFNEKYVVYVQGL